MSVPESLRKALQEVTAVSSQKSEVGEWARMVRPLLEQAVADLAAVTVTRPSRRGTGDITYIVEKTQQGEVLTENRVGGKSKPFRCPKAVYEALAAVLGETERPLAVDEIMTAVEERLGMRPADHQVRAVLRFWLHTVPPLITRNRARHRPIRSASIVREVTELWGHLAASSS